MQRPGRGRGAAEEGAGGAAAGYLWMAQRRAVVEPLGTTLLLGVLCACLQYLLSANHYRDWALFLSACGVWLAAGTVLLAGLHQPRSRWGLPVLLLGTTVAISVAVYAAGAPGPGMVFYYLWVTPYAFVFLSGPQAALQTAAVAVGVLVVQAAQIHAHPGLGPLSAKVPLVIGVVASLTVIGMLARRLFGQAREADDRFRRGFDFAPFGLAFVSAGGRWLEVNDACCEILGRARADLVGMPVAEALGDTVPGLLGRAVPSAPQEFVAQIRRPEGEQAWVAGSVVAVRDQRADGAAYLQLTDITDSRRDREALLRQARHDALTGLANRAAFLDGLAAALEREPSGSGIAVALVDFDRFKDINDSLGHHVGDGLLVAMAPRLAAATRQGDLLARLGGDEFVVLCTGVTGTLDALERAGALLRAAAEPVAAGGVTHEISASIGVALAGPGATVSGLLADADTAMYQAKAQGRGRIEVFDSELRTRAGRRLALEQELRAGLRRGEFFLEYQPVVDGSGRAVAFEALVRWRNPERGLLGPDEFIAVAEDTGLICDLGAWVLDTACRDLASWQAVLPAAGSIGVAVNVSPRQLDQADVVETVEAILARSGVRPGTVALELTEQVLADPDRAWRGRLLGLKALGPRLLLDDFGTGYSSLAYLKRFPVDGLKIDRSFVAGLGAAEERAIVEAVIRLGDALALEVIAEGVETEAQRGVLSAMGCELIQGFLVARPLPAAAVAGWIAGRAGRLDPELPGAGAVELA